MDVGTTLVQARQRCGISLEDIARSTKVSKQTLDHIDHNRFSRLPGGILTKGHLRAYAAEVGLDPDRIVRDYLSQWFGESAEELPIAPRPPVEGETHPGRALLLEIVAVALLIGLYESYGLSPGLPSAPASAEMQTLPTSVQFTSVATQVVPVTSGAPLADESEPGVQLEIRPSGQCWVSVTADDQLVVYRLLQPGDTAALRAREALVLRVGDPETFVYWLNGLPGRQLGPAGTPVTVRITEDNYETFVDGSRGSLPRASDVRDATSQATL